MKPVIAIVLFAIVLCIGFAMGVAARPEALTDNVRIVEQ